MATINGWKQIYNTTLTEDATSLTISSLTGDTAKEYMLSARISNSYAGTSDYQIRPNNVSTAANYGYQYILGSNAATGAARGTGTGFDLAPNDASQVCFNNTIIQAKSGYVRTAITEYASRINGTTIDSVALFGQSWNNTTDEITSLVIAASQSGGLGSGTQITLYQRATMTTIAPTTPIEWVTP
jgi:hypothetical protein